MDKQELSIDEMKEKLESYGNKHIWKSIEAIKDPLERLSFRQLFFIAGGSLDE